MPKFTNNGIINCNTVRYNYKQARNMIADGSYGNISGNNVWNNIQAIDGNAGYKSYRVIKVTNDNMTTQKIPQLISGHKYYFSCRYLTPDVTQCFLGLRNGSSDLFSVFTGVSATNWKLASILYNCTSTVSADNANVCIWVPSGTIYVCRFILIDLTDTFSSGKEPTKDWCDNNIREQEVITNFGNIANHVSYSNIGTRYPATGLLKNNYNYLTWDQSDKPRDYFWELTSITGQPEGYLYSDSNFNLTQNNIYYGYVELYNGQVITPQSCQMYWPEAEPSLGTTPLVLNFAFNQGGGMEEWKRVSFYNNRNTFSTGSYKFRFDYDNNNVSTIIWVTALNLQNVQTQVNMYNQYNGTSITLNDVNKEWCDRWIDGRSSPIIHIKDPNNTTIKFQPFKQIKRDILHSYTRAQLNDFVKMYNDTWTTGVSNNHINNGDFAYIDCLISDENNKKARVYVQVITVNSTTNIYTNNLWYADETQDGYNIPVDIICNDIEIRPEINTIKFDKTGTIKCKKLIRAQAY